MLILVKNMEKNMSVDTNHIVSDNSDFFKNIPEVNLYQTKLDNLSQVWNTLNLLNQVNEGGASMESTQDAFNNLTLNLLHHLTHESLKQIANEVESKSQVVVDIIIRNLFERTADIGFLSTDDAIRDFFRHYEQLAISLASITQYSPKKSSCEVCPTPFKLACQNGLASQELNFVKNILCQPDAQQMQDRISRETLKQSLKSRFKEYVNKYSVYYDVILTDTKGNVLINLDQSNVIEKSNDSIIYEALNTKYPFIEKLGKTDLRVDKESALLYACKVTNSNDEKSENLGVLILCFKFCDETELIFDGLKQTNNALNLMLLDKSGIVIATSNPLHMPIGKPMSVVRSKTFDIVNYGGRKYIAKTAKTKGYEGYFGLGWLGHVMIPLEEAFLNEKENILNKIDKHILEGVMESTSLFSQELQSIPVEAKKIQEDLNRMVWNGSLKQKSSIGKKLLSQVSLTGEKTKSIFNESIASLHETVLKTLLNVVHFKAYLGINIMDRNLYERANDCRWWALTPKFREILNKQHLIFQDTEELTSILVYINQLYTVYTNLVLFDNDGMVVAVSNEKHNSMVGLKLTQDWVTRTLALQDSQQYIVSKFEKTSLYNSNYTYVYNACIKSPDSAKTVGGIAIVFDGEPQFEVILNDILTNKEDAFALFATKDKIVISSSNKRFEVGELVDIQNNFFKLAHNESYSSIIEFEGEYYAIGSYCSSGYREYKTVDGYSNDVICLVFIPLGVADKKNKELQQQDDLTLAEYKSDGTSTREFGTFFIGKFWYGFDIDDLDGSIAAEGIQPINRNNMVAGRVFYKNESLEVLDLYKFLNASKSEELQIIVFKYYTTPNKTRFLGLLATKLGPICEVPQSHVGKASSLLRNETNIIKEIVKPPLNYKQMLSIISVESLLRILQKFEL